MFVCAKIHFCVMAINVNKGKAKLMKTNNLKEPVITPRNGATAGTGRYYFILQNVATVKFYGNV